MASRPISVLLFEDDEGQALLTKEALEKEGCVVETCQTGREGLERLVAKEYQIYLVDMKLPDLQGIELLKRIRTVHPDAVAIIVTGHGDESVAVEAMKLGAADYVVKSPYMGHLAALPMVIRESLERHQLRDEREQLQTELWEHARLLEERNAELRRANEELKRLDQLKTDLVSMVSHELRTPLATIKEFTAILADQIAGPVGSRQQEFLGIIKGNVDRLARIIDDLLDMAKIEAGRVVLQRTFVEPEPLLRAVVESMRPIAEAKGLTLEVHAPRVSGVFADADKVTQVLLNLVSNAIKYTNGASGRVTLRLEEHSNEVRFDVSDTGAGIAPEDVPKLFEKFQQLQRDAGEGGAKGTGLGLSISKRLVELHGGRIWATSAPGQGSTFSFTLPKYHVEEVFHEYLRSGLDQAARNQTSLSVVVFSLQGFQDLKAVYGLEEAGRILREVETLVREVVRRQAGDVVVRWQSGEMVIILAEVDKTGAKAIAERIRRAVEQHTFTLGGKPLTLAVATATATYPEEAATDDELLRTIERRISQTAKTKTRVLVVDDEAKIRRFLKEALELREYEVLGAASGPEAIDLLQKASVDLILLDVMMPVMDGYEVYHLIKENPATQRIPVIIITAKGERKDRELGLEGAHYNYVAKPFQLEDLLAKICEVLQQRAAVKP
jgi:diguanylate cyclase (GGDEF)-like protein